MDYGAVLLILAAALVSFFLGLRRGRSAGGSLEIESPAAEGDSGPRRRPRTMTPWYVLVNALGEHCDFSKLPQFDAVKKYFGPSVGYVKGTEQGLYFEMKSLRAPGE